MAGYSCWARPALPKRHWKEVPLAFVTVLIVSNKSALVAGKL
jgi:hypothetical protein